MYRGQNQPQQHLDARLGHLPVGLGHQLDQRVQWHLQPRDVLHRTAKTWLEKEFLQDPTTSC